MSADLSASSVSHTVIGVDPARALERVLYRCAKQDRDRRRHALVGHVARSDFIERGSCPVGAGGHGCVCQSVNDVGEPCAGEPHARFDAAAGGNPGPVGHGRTAPDASRRPYKGALRRRSLWAHGCRCPIPPERRARSSSL
jgi:hypothetical protein